MFSLLKSEQHSVHLWNSHPILKYGGRGHSWFQPPSCLRPRSALSSALCPRAERCHPCDDFTCAEIKEWHQARVSAALWGLGKHCLAPGASEVKAFSDPEQCSISAPNTHECPVFVKISNGKRLCSSAQSRTQRPDLNVHLNSER